MSSWFRYGLAAGALFAGLAVLGIGVVVLRGGVEGPVRAVERVAPPEAGVKPAMRPSRPMNVVLVVGDALRADHVLTRRQGEPLMPYLAGLVEHGGVYFANAVTPCTWTRPAMTSIFTSMYVETHQVCFDSDPDGVRQADVVSESLELMGQYFKRAGYATIGIQTNGNLVPEFGYARGYDVYEHHHDAPAEEITRRALAQVQAVAGRPYFLYVHYIDPHVPYVPPEAYRGRFNSISLSPGEKEVVLDFLPYLMDHCSWKIGQKPALDYPALSPAGREAVRALYEGEVRYLDDQLKVLLESLPERENTCVVVLADHGESFWEHDYVGHGLTCYAEVTQVPLLFMAPGLTPDVRTEPVETLSVLPTLAALVGLPASPEWQGVDLLAPAMAPERPVYSWTSGPWQSMSIEREMVQAGPWKLIRDAKTDTVLLFDVQADPAEQRDMAQAREDLVGPLRQLLETHKRGAIAARGKRTRESAAVDAETQRQMKELGYDKSGGTKPEELRDNAAQ